MEPQWLTSSKRRKNVSCRKNWSEDATVNATLTRGCEIQDGGPRLLDYWSNKHLSSDTKHFVSSSSFLSFFHAKKTDYNIKWPSGRIYQRVLQQNLHHEPGQYRQSQFHSKQQETLSGFNLQHRYTTIHVSISTLHRRKQLTHFNQKTGLDSRIVLIEVLHREFQALHHSLEYSQSWRGRFHPQVLSPCSVRFFYSEKMTFLFPSCYLRMCTQHQPHVSSRRADGPRGKLSRE